VELSRSTVEPSLASLRALLPEEIGEQLGAVEKTLVGVAEGAPRPLAAPVHEVLTSGGKRLRPLLMILSANMGEPDREALVSAAAAVEVLHTATLIHDDVVDRAESRRGRPTTVAAYGREVAVATGDYLFAESFARLADIGDPRIVRVFAEAARDLASGELEQFRASGDEVGIEEYLRHIRMKTAGLFKAACVAGGTLGGLSIRRIDALATYGQSLGVAFQMSDDVMDFVGEPGVMGKGAGSDLAEGTITLPIILAMQEGNAGLIRKVLRTPRPEKALLEAGIEAVLETRAIAGTEERARKEIETALMELELLPAGPERDVLHMIASEVVGRDA